MCRRQLLDFRQRQECILHKLRTRIIRHDFELFSLLSVSIWLFLLSWFNCQWFRGLSSGQFFHGRVRHIQLLHPLQSRILFSIIYDIRVYALCCWNVFGNFWIKQFQYLFELSSGSILSRSFEFSQIVSLQYLVIV